MSEETPYEMKRLERTTAITGVGQSKVGRRLGLDPLALTADACLAAIEDAGLTRDDIDGLSTYPGGAIPGAPGFSGAGCTDVQEMLRLNLNWFCGGPELPGQLGAVANACLAVATGLAKASPWRRGSRSTCSAFAQCGNPPRRGVGHVPASGWGAAVADASAPVASCSGTCPSARLPRRCGSA